MELVFATNNKHKIEEISHILQDHFTLLSLEDIGCTTDLPEEQDTLEGNASQKARYIADHFGLSCFADDTGLEIEAMGGEPGVFSARYAGSEKDSEANMDKVLVRLSKINNRKARFRTVISLILGGVEYLFEGIVEGEILHERKGDLGFGYDPIFKPYESDKAFAEMSLHEKNSISHRARAMSKLVHFLNQQRTI